MQLAFNSKSLRSICENEADARRELGVAAAEVLKRRLADLCASTSLMELPLGPPQIINVEGQQYMSVNLGGEYQMVFCSNHPRPPLTATGELDWTQVSRIRILQIGRPNV